MTHTTMRALYVITQRLGYDGEDLIAVFTSEKARDNYKRRNPRLRGDDTYYEDREVRVLGEDE
jgi:hypothetical protein